MKIRPVIGITGNERPFPDDPDANMSYAATGFIEAVKEAGGIPLILPIGDADMAKHYMSMIDKLIITGGQSSSTGFTNRALIRVQLYPISFKRFRT